MNSAPHLRLEDRPEFERVLDEALRTIAKTQPDQTPRLSSGELRTLAVADAATITAHAATEYEEYVRVRELLRQPGTTTPGTPGGPQSADETTPRLITSMSENRGAGVFAVLSVLLPVLAGSAAVIFLLVGYALGVTSPEPALAAPMRNIGWVFAAVTVAASLIGAVSLLLTASRNAPTARREAGKSQRRTDDDVTVARAAWRHALLQRGILPFLRDVQLRAAESPDGSRTPGPRLPEDDHRTPRLGYSGPDFSVPTHGHAEEGTGERNRYSSPKYGSSRFSSPKYSTDGGSYPESPTSEQSDGPRYASPDFSAPTTDGRGSGDAAGRRFSSPAYRSGSTGGDAGGRRFASPKWESGSVDSPAEDSEGHRFASPGFKSGSTNHTTSSESAEPTKPRPPRSPDEDNAETDGAPRG